MYKQNIKKKCILPTINLKNYYKKQNNTQGMFFGNSWLYDTKLTGIEAKLLKNSGFDRIYFSVFLFLRRFIRGDPTQFF
jgi:hypothetical protein